MLRDIAWSQKFRAFDDRLGRSLLRAWHHGAADEQITDMIRGRVRRLRVQEVFGQLEPFAEPRLSKGNLLIGGSSGGQEIRIPLQSLTAGTLIAMRTGGGKSCFLRLLTPDIAAVHQYQSNVAYLKGDRDGAAEALERAIELEPDNALFRENLRRLRNGS